MNYLVLKTIHLIAVVCWFAGLFYMGRLFIYHKEAEKRKADRIRKENELKNNLISIALALSDNERERIKKKEELKKKAGDANKGGERKKGQKSVNVKTGA